MLAKDADFDQLLALAQSAHRAEYEEGVKACRDGLFFHEGPYSRPCDENETVEQYAQGLAWRMGWNDAALRGEHPILSDKNPGYMEEGPAS